MNTLKCKSQHTMMFDYLNSTDIISISIDNDSLKYLKYSFFNLTKFNEQFSLKIFKQTKKESPLYSADKCVC